MTSKPTSWVMAGQAGRAKGTREAKLRPELELGPFGAAERRKASQARTSTSRELARRTTSSRQVCSQAGMWHEMSDLC